MTARSRKAIVEYWLWKHWMATSLFVFAILFTSQASAEVKAIQAKPLEQKSAVKAQTASPIVAAAKDEKKKDEKVIEKTVTGTVVFVRKNKMSVQFGSNEQDGDLEMFLTLDKNVKLKGAKDFSKLQHGDEVKVKYSETYREPKEKGGANVVLSRVGTEIQFVKAALKVQVVQSDAIVGVEGS